MGKLALTALVGPTDKGAHFDKSAYTTYADLPFVKYGNKRDVRMGNFLIALKRLKLQPSELAMDLLIIASSMYAADTRIDRKKFGEDSWTRLIDLYIPVSDATVWDSQKELLESIFKFLTGDIWNINFRPRTDQKLTLSPAKSKLKKFGMTYQTNTVCLFSGGMDSFIGAIKLLEEGVQPLLVSHSKSGDVSPYQKKCLQALASAYKSTPPAQVYSFIQIPKGNLFKSEDHTERGRSFLFLTLGAICATTLGPQTKLFVPENGMISMNIPLTPLRAGSHSTRTTHPHYFSMMQELYDNLKLGVTIVNPFQFKTKGEMLKECANNSLVTKTDTMSCSHPSGRYKRLGNGHCGYCVPCIIRQASYNAAGLADKSTYRKNILSSLGLHVNAAEGTDILAFKYMIEKVRKHPEYLTAAIRGTGPLGEDVSKYLDVYKRALVEVENLVKGIKLI